MIRELIVFSFASLMFVMALSLGRYAVAPGVGAFVLPRYFHLRYFGAVTQLLEVCMLIPSFYRDLAFIELLRFCINDVTTAFERHSGGRVGKCTMQSYAEQVTQPSDWNWMANNYIAKCPAIPGLATKEYSIDFTKETRQPSNWTLADQATVKYGSNGADFTFAKRFDAPYIWTSFYFLFGRVEVVVKASKGTGIVTGAVLMSDCLDEIDWEWSGSNFGSTAGKVQTNVFGKGITGVYNRGTQPAVSNPSDEFHTYVLDWTPDSLIWSIDGKQVRQEDNNKQLTGNYQYPQTPSRLHLGIWNGGDANSSYGVVQWVGGHTDLDKAPYTAYIKSVKITNQFPCSSWQYPENFKGAWTECKCTNETIASPTPTSTATPKPTNLPCTYTVSTGDYGYGIADKLHVAFADLNSANNGIDWDKLLLGQQLKVPGGNCSTTTAAPSNTTMAATATSAATTDITTEIVMTTLTTCPVTVTHTSGSSTFTSITKTVSTVVITSTSTVCTRCTAAPYSNTTTSTALTGTGQSCVYYVTAGDNGYGISQKVKVSFSDLNAANPVDWDKLLVGQGLKIPGSKCFPMGNNITSTATAPGMTSGCSLPPYANTTISATITPASNTTSPKPISTGAKYVVCEGDYGYKIVEKLGCSFDDLNKANPDCDWDKLLVGQQLNACKNTPANNTNVVTPAQSTNVLAQSTKPTTATQNGTALSTITVKPSGSKTSDINEICVIKSTTVCPSSPVADMNRTTSTAIYTNGSISVVPTTISTPKLCEYNMVNGDYGYKIAENLGITFDELNRANPGQDWDKLLIGQILKVPGDQCSSKTTSTQTATSTRTNTVVIGKSGTTTVPPQTPASSSSFTAPATNVNIPSQPGTTTSATSTGTSSLSTSITSTTPPPVCNHDNCYNNMVDKRYSSSVVPFCSMFMAPGNTNVSIPTYLGGCQTKSERVSSACKCIMTPTPSPSSPSTSSVFTSGSSSGPLTSTESSTSTSSGTVGTTVVTTGSTDTVLTSSGTTPATLGTTATTESSWSITSGTAPATLGTTSLSSTSGSTTGSTSSSSTSSGSTSSTTLGTSSSSTGTLGTTSSTLTTASTSSTTPGTSTPPTTSSSSSSSSSTTPQTTPPTTTSSTAAPTSPPTTPPTTKPTTPPTTRPTTSTQPPKTPPTTSHKTTTTQGWNDWSGGSGGNGANGWSDWSGSQGGQGMGGNSGRGNTQDMIKGSGNNAAMGGQAAHHKRDAAAPFAGVGFGGGMASSGGQDKGSSSSGSGFFGKFGWGKRSPSAAPPNGAGAGNMGQGAGQGMSGGSAPAQGMPAGQGPPGSGSGGFFNKALGGWKRSPQDADADTPGGAQGRPWGKRQADTLSQANNVLSQAGQQLSGTVTKTKASAAVATGAAGATGAAPKGTPKGSIGYAGNAPTGSAAATAAATPKASSGSAGSAGSGSPAPRRGSGSGSASGQTNDMVPDLGSKLGSAPAAGAGAGDMAGAGNMAGSDAADMGGAGGTAGPGGMAGGDMAGSGGWGNWMKKFAAGMAGFR